MRAGAGRDEQAGPVTLGEQPFWVFKAEAHIDSWVKAQAVALTYALHSKPTIFQLKLALLWAHKVPPPSVCTLL